MKKKTTSDSIVGILVYLKTREYSAKWKMFFSSSSVSSTTLRLDDIRPCLFLLIAFKASQGIVNNCFSGQATTGFLDERLQG